MRPTRRGFLSTAGLGLAALVARKHLVAFGAPGGGRKTVVVVVQRGAVDGLAMIPPHGDPLLAAARPTLAAAKPADLDGYWGLHAGLATLVPHYQAKRLAIVPAVGLPGASRSHFEAQDLLEQGGVVAATGWANRVRARVNGPSADTAAIAVGNTLPRALAGASPSLVIEASGQVGLARGAPPARRAQLVAAFNELYAQGTDAFSATARRALASTAHVEQALATLPAKTAQPKGPMGQALSTAARLIRADLGAELIVVDTGGWDTHTAQTARLDRNFAMLGEAIALFADELGDRLADVTLLTVSEFGRTVRENGSGGTDHGTATMSLVLGGAVAGGRVVGAFPGLREDQRFEGRDLAIATDVRDLLAECLGTLGLSDDTLHAAFPDHERRRVGVI
jgi:uncharacterized protein (DUF1501 family)